MADVDGMREFGGVLGMGLFNGGIEGVGNKEVAGIWLDRNKTIRVVSFQIGSQM